MKHEALFTGELYNVELRTGDKWKRWTTDNDLEVQRSRFDYQAERLEKGFKVDFDGVRLVNNATGEVLDEAPKGPQKLQSDPAGAHA